jgi:hypothetical protein
LPQPPKRGCANFMATVFKDLSSILVDGGKKSTPRQASTWVRAQWARSLQGYRDFGFAAEAAPHHLHAPYTMDSPSCPSGSPANSARWGESRSAAGGGSGSTEN